MTSYKAKFASQQIIQAVCMMHWHKHSCNTVSAIKQTDNTLPIGTVATEPSTASQ